MGGGVGGVGGVWGRGGALHGSSAALHAGLLPVGFGRDVLTALTALALAARQVKEEGFEVAHGGYTITIFSAPNYCDQMVRDQAGRRRL